MPSSKCDHDITRSSCAICSRHAPAAPPTVARPPVTPTSGYGRSGHVIRHPQPTSAGPRPATPTAPRLRPSQRAPRKPYADPRYLRDCGNPGPMGSEGQHHRAFIR